MILIDVTGEKSDNWRVGRIGMKCKNFTEYVYKALQKLTINHNVSCIQCFLTHASHYCLTHNVWAVWIGLHNTGLVRTIFPIWHRISTSILFSMVDVCPTIANRWRYQTIRRAIQWRSSSHDGFLPFEGDACSVHWSPRVTRQTLLCFGTGTFYSQ